MPFGINRQENLKTLKLDVDLQGENPETQLLNHLHETGCAVLDNHDVPTDLLKDIFEQWNNYFSSKDKYNWLRTDETDEGFIPINFETAKKDEVADFKELYQVHYNGVLPNNINCESTLTLFNSLVKTGERICELLDKALPDTIKKTMSMPLSKMVGGSNNHLLRIIHYPAVEKGVNIPRAAAHTDICLFTTAFGSAFRGLELQDNEGNWYTPAVQEKSLVIFNSEMLDICTNGYLKATTHRVKANPNNHNGSRYSFPVGIHPKRNVELRNGFTAAKHLLNRLNEMGYDGNKLNLEDH